MHRRDASTEVVTQAALEYAVERMRMDPPPLHAPCSPKELLAAVGETVTPSGLGGEEAFRIFRDVLAPACISSDHPRNLAFIPCAPTEASTLFDVVVSASVLYGGSWMEGSGAVFAENQALRYIADLAGLPEEAGGAFVSGGTAGNLSALIAARHTWRVRADGRFDRTRGLLLVSTGAHASIVAAARAIDVDVVTVPGDEIGRLTAPALADAVAGLGPHERQRVFAVVATAGTTNAGAVDDLAAVAEVAQTYGWWMHVDAAYGGAALAAASVRWMFEGIERADSVIVDPHKWLFAPFDCCALVYRDPSLARAAHTQHAEYLDVLHDVADDLCTPDWNPSDYAYHLSRRSRGLPLWFSLATHGTDAYAEAVEATLAVAREAAREIDAAEHTDLLMEPQLSVVMFRRRGWAAGDYRRWSEEMLLRGRAFVMPTRWKSETVLRICIVNPRTTIDDVRELLDSLR